MMPTGFLGKRGLWVVVAVLRPHPPLPARTGAIVLTFSQEIAVVLQALCGDDTGIASGVQMRVSPAVEFARRSPMHAIDAGLSNGESETRDNAGQ